MKKILIVLFAVLLAFWCSATDRFYISDFAISPGETRTVSIMLDNETAYTAFQCDIYMPEGLTVEQEDGDYIFDLTSRKGRDHNIASQTQVDGSIRVMSYSPSIKAYNGNDGALVTFNVTASQDFTGHATIQLKSILFTTTAGSEVAFDDEECTVGLLGDVNDNGVVNIGDVTTLISYVLGGDPGTVILTNADMNGDGNLNVSDVTALIHLLLSNN